VRRHAADADAVAQCTADGVSATREAVARGMARTVADVKRLIDRPSVSAEGGGLDECADLCAELMREYGFASEVCATAGAPVVIGRRGRGQRALLLYCHYDTQPAGPGKLWTSPPFAAEVRDGRLYGRGAVDDKGHIVSRLAAIGAYCAAHGELPFEVIFLVEGEEEIGSPSLRAFVEANRDRLRADGGIWEYGTVDHHDRPVFELGARGIVDVVLELETANVDVHSGLYSHLPNAAWRLTWALASLKDQSERIQIDGFYDRVRPPTPAQLALLDGLPDSDADERAQFAVERFAGDLAGVARRRAVLLPTCTINGLTAGHQGEGPMAIVPHRATARLDFRLVPDQQPDEVVAALRRHLSRRGFDDVRVRPGFGSRPAAVDPDDPFVRTVIDSAVEVYQQEPIVHPLIGGSGPLDLFIYDLGVPVVIGVGVDRPGGRAHAPDEHVHLEELERGTKHMAALLERLAWKWAAR
jgi:acetylornithine deacetylase/succinyl-diaminopimelate desuccinylase-like protein